MSDSHSSVLLKETHDVEVGEHTAGYTMDSKKIKNILKKLNVMQAAAENRTEFDRIGKQEALAKLLAVDIKYGLSSQQVVESRACFGDNVMPDMPMKSFCELFIASFNDFVLIVLIVAAIISLALGLFGPESNHNPHAWIEGAAIMMAVFIVAIVTAGNDYAKELQFRALAKFAQTMESCTVIRDGKQKTLHPKEIVVGDVLVVKGGDQAFADACLFECDEQLGVTMDEAALTGESEVVKKTTKGDPFLLSSTVCSSHGNAPDCKAIVIGVGEFSQWGIISANLDQAEVNTPLQDKLEDMVVVIGYLGTACAFLTFGVTLIYIAVRDPATQDWIDGIIEAFIIAITIIVVAIPEGLPLAVTISLAYSMKKMAYDNNLVKTLQACETMGNATNICSDKTGTLTQGRMALVEGWFGDQFIRENEFQSFFDNYRDGPKPQGKDSWKKEGNPGWLEPLLQNIGINSSGEVTYGYTYFAPPRDKEPVSLPWQVDDELCSTKMPEAWGEDRLKEARFVQVNKDRPEHSNMTELAMLTFAHQLDFDTIAAKRDMHVQKVIPFDFKRVRSSAIIGIGNDKYRVMVKGAPEYMIKFCKFYATRTGEKAVLDEAKLAELSQAQDAMTEGQKRVICLAHKDVDASSLSNPPAEMSQEELDALCTSDLVVDAYVGIIDPLRPDVPASVATAQAAGVKVRMVTGDNVKTATAIARKAGIFKEGDIAIEGPAFRMLTPAQVDEMLPRLSVVARCAPEDKLLLVTRLNGKNIPKNEEEWLLAHPGRDYNSEKDLLLPGYRAEWDQSHAGGGDVVGVTGDGTNDAPALKAADVGLAMNSGTSVAKGAADIVILDDNFSSIVSSIKWGRCVYDNIRKFLQFQLTVNVVALLLVLIGALIGLEDPPLNAVQMLWVNLIMDTMGALALGTEQPNDELLLRPPYKRDASLVNRPMVRNILFQSAYQLTALLLLLLMGAEWFSVEEGNSCGQYERRAYKGETAWNWNMNGKWMGKGQGMVGCDTFLDGLLEDGSTAESAGYSKLDCSKDRSYSCYADNYGDFHENPKNHDEFSETCLQCKNFDFVHFTIIFNAFVFCQVFNEFNARSISDDWHVFRGLSKNPIFIAVVIITFALQIFIVELGGLFTKTSPLNAWQWIITVAIGFGSLPMGVLMRLIPITEDPQNYASNPNR